MHWESFLNLLWLIIIIIKSSDATDHSYQTDDFEEHPKESVFNYYASWCELSKCPECLYLCKEGAERKFKGCCNSLTDYQARRSLRRHPPHGWSATTERTTDHRPDFCDEKCNRKCAFYCTAKTYRIYKLCCKHYEKD